jgi:hypothetical protein
VAAAARRIAVLVGSVVAVTAVGSLLIGLLAGAGVWRALSLGWYIVGSVLLISGFFVGNRGPSRAQGEGWSTFSTRRWVRWATPDEQRDAVSFSVLLVAMGIVLIVLGAFADTRYTII